MRLSLPESFPNYETLRESVEEQVRFLPLSFLPSSSPTNHSKEPTLGSNFGPAVKRNLT